MKCKITIKTPWLHLYSLESRWTWDDDAGLEWCCNRGLREYEIPPQALVRLVVTTSETSGASEEKLGVRPLFKPLADALTKAGFSQGDTVYWWPELWIEGR